jgi:hypothetical protein
LRKWLGRAEFVMTWKEEPVSSALLAIPRLYATWFRHYPWFANRDFSLHPWYPYYESAIALQWYLYLILIVGGAAFTRGTRSPAEWTVLCLLLYWVCLHAVILGDPRYRQPIIPFLLPYAAFMALCVLPRWSQVREAVDLKAVAPCDRKCGHV